MKALILVTAATLFMAGAVNAADDMSMKKMTTAECSVALGACANDANPDACKQRLKDNNGCSLDTPATVQ